MKKKQEKFTLTRLGYRSACMLRSAKCQVLTIMTELHPMISQAMNLWRYTGFKRTVHTSSQMDNNYSKYLMRLSCVSMGNNSDYIITDTIMETMHIGQQLLHDAKTTKEYRHMLYIRQFSQLMRPASSLNLAIDRKRQPH